MNRQLTSVIAIVMSLSVSSAWAESKSMKKSTEMERTMDDSAMSGMDHGAMEKMSGMKGMESGSMGGTMQGGSAPVDARDPHAYSGGLVFDPMRPHLADERSFGSLLVDRLEMVRTSGDNAAAYDLQAWYGRDFNRAVLKLEGEYADGEFEEASTELLWSRSVSTFWDMQLGLRHDSGVNPDRSWLAFGFQGLAPYWFELDVTAYLGESGRSALGFEAEYELLFTQKLILQPRIEADIYGKDDPESALGSGLSNMTTGLRLRYEIRREFAPYIGVEWASKFGDTADYARIAGGSKSNTSVVAGVRFWF